MRCEVTRDDLDAGLDRVIAAVLAQAGIGDPPVDAFAVARRLGMTIATDDCQKGRARFVRLCERRSQRVRPTILLRSEPRRERMHWAVAHEIGEHMACHVFRELEIDPTESGDNAREQIANHLANRLLLPTPWFVADAAAYEWDLPALKARYCTASHELIARRMLECQPAIIVSVFDQKQLSWRRSNVTGRVPPPSSGEMDCWRVVHHCNLPMRKEFGRMSILGWPVHEAGWQREILRTEVGSDVTECDWDS